MHANSGDSKSYYDVKCNPHQSQHPTTLNSATNNCKSKQRHCEQLWFLAEHWYNWLPEKMLKHIFVMEVLRLIKFKMLINLLTNWSKRELWKYVHSLEFWSQQQRLSCNGKLKLNSKKLLITISHNFTFTGSYFY